MNNKGQTMGILITVFITIVVGLALFQPSAANVGIVTTLVDQPNQSITFPVSGGAVVLNGQSVSGLVVRNGTIGPIVSSGNYSIDNYNTTTGVYRARLVMTTAQFAGLPGILTYTYEPVGYSTDASVRSITPLILIFSALAVGVIALIAVGRSGILDLIKG